MPDFQEVLTQAITAKIEEQKTLETKYQLMGLMLHSLMKKYNTNEFSITQEEIENLASIPTCLQFMVEPGPWPLNEKAVIIREVPDPAHSNFKKQTH